MNSFLFAIGAVLPVILTVGVGYLLKKSGMVDDGFAKVTNRLVFRIFLPVMLFRNVYGINSIANINLGYMVYGIALVFIIFLLSIPTVMAVTKQSDRRGPLLQSGFRSNYALIGIPLVESLFGSAGLSAATLLSAVSIPIFNILAVISLSLFGNGGQKPSFKKILSGIVKNPLIQGIFGGILVLLIRAVFVRYNISFRLSDIKPLYTVLGYFANLATPLALLMLGVEFDFSAVEGFKKEIIFGVLIRTVAVPLLGLGIAGLFFRQYFGGAEFASLIALFATPVAVSSVAMAQEMGADSALAGQLVVWTTPLSAITVFIATFILKTIGIF